ncbi:MAG TPA: hypothetical protein IGS52_02205 [Oscillatoriaceae cyanobacterium M33_DOE_052]|nr:hypothetical protein [Oscillatoriaceae cyanobacterium M33_DOE_052]
MRHMPHPVPPSPRPPISPSPRSVSEAEPRLPLSSRANPTSPRVLTPHWSTLHYQKAPTPNP